MAATHMAATLIIVDSHFKRHFAFTKAHPQNGLHGNLTSTTETYAPLPQQTIPIPKPARGPAAWGRRAGRHPPETPSRCTARRQVADGSLRACLKSATRGEQLFCFGLRECCFFPRPRQRPYHLARGSGRGRRRPRRRERVTWPAQRWL
jgi:hypothetical protein